MKPIWFNFLAGPMVISEERFGLLQSEQDPLAINLFRNFKKLSDASKDHTFFAKQIRNARKPEAVLPHIYYLADRLQPFYRQEIHDLFCSAKYPAYKGNLCVLIDVSKAMKVRTMAGVDRMEFAACMAVASRAKSKRIFTVSNTLVEIHTPHEGLGGIDKIISSQRCGGDNLEHAIKDINALGKFDHVLVYSQKAFHLKGQLMLPNNYTVH